MTTDPTPEPDEQQPEQAEQQQPQGMPYYRMNPMLASTRSYLTVDLERDVKGQTFMFLTIHTAVGPISVTLTRDEAMRWGQQIKQAASHISPLTVPAAGAIPDLSKLVAAQNGQSK